MRRARGKAEIFVLSKPLRNAIWCQVLVAMVATALGGWFAGSRGMTSAFLGGMISLVAGFAFAAMASRKTAKSPTQALLAALKAEAVKIGLAVLLLLVVLVTYKEVAVAWLVVSFVATLLSFSITAFVREA